MFELIAIQFDLFFARMHYKRAERACLRAAASDSVPSGMWEALDRVRFECGEELIRAEVAALRGYTEAAY